MSHLVFYDGQCGFCDHAVQFILKHDSEKKFLFAPLQGSTAAKELSTVFPAYHDLNTLVLIENYQTPQQKIYVRGKGSFRILWLLGGCWKWMGWISFLPSFSYDWGYRLVAYNRGKLYSMLFNQECVLKTPSNSSRFLP
jgi:predicted DCC family thiol-disulfide oxidoreductase YuxK